MFMLKKTNILLVDLNNFARYPTLAIGYLLAPLRKAGAEVKVLSPLSFGATAFERERTETFKEHFMRRLYFSTHPLMLKIHERLRERVAKHQSRPHPATIAAVKDWLDNNKTDIILLSVYLDHYPSVKVIAELALERNIPVFLGGPAFTHEETIKDWLKLPGVTALFAGEADLSISYLIKNMLSASGEIKTLPGLYTANNIDDAYVAPTLKALDALPNPDFSDFPWDYYPHRIIPVMTGRGCSWNVCTFCSDVITANGRSFRTRSLEKVLEEIRHQTETYQSKDVMFLDLKLNSDLEIWRGVIDNFQGIIPGGHWIGTVHVNARGDNGLSYEELKAAKDSGLVRMSFGLETGSQSLNRRMSKGTNMERNAQFVRDADRAGISLRASMMLGYPGETAEDVQASVDFLKEHQDCFDRIRLARFKAIPGTRFSYLHEKRPGRFAGIKNFHWNYRHARGSYEYQTATDKAYRQAKRELLRIIHAINRKPLKQIAEQFDGLM
jgi:radical SAM superfamily enzyme YgiQ (UPF0313 family)